KDDMLEANRVVLGHTIRRIDGEVSDDSTVTGEVVVAAGATIVKSIVRGPVVIGTGTQIENAYVGPFTSIGDGCRIEDCEIEQSIVMNNSIVRNIPLRISDSLIGKEVIVERRQELPHTVKLLLGDHAQVGFA
ncbi:MAG TPA: hypothetical protein VNZ58_00375, partial [Thermomicrobiales bacterium]|nr:hypothetical protein [Thermomicrobiales bacterium]